MSKVNLDQIEKIKTIDQLAKVFSFEYLIRLVIRDLKNKEYHVKRNKMISQFFKEHKNEFSK